MSSLSVIREIIVYNDVKEEPKNKQNEAKN